MSPQAGLQVRTVEEGGRVATQGPGEEIKIGALAFAAALIAVAGFVDAVGFLTLGGLFVSFMSGNSTQAAIAATQGVWDKAAPAGAIVALFVFGVVCGRLVVGAVKNRRRSLILALEAVFLSAAALTPHSIAIALMAFSMGAQNAVAHKAGPARTSLTYVTGTLVNFGESLAEAILGTGSARLSLAYLLQWASLIVGGVLGAVGYRSFGLESLFAPSAMLASLAGITVLSFQARGYEVKS
jgi:uncharacterized membrane protein YoaK (UPF0700 family)